MRHHRLLLPIILLAGALLAGAAALTPAPPSATRTLAMILQRESPEQSEPTAYEIRIPAEQACGTFALLASAPVSVTQKDIGSDSTAPHLSSIRRYETARKRFAKFPGDACTVTITPLRRDKPTLVVFACGGSGMVFPETSDPLFKTLETDLEKLRQLHAQQQSAESHP